MKNYSDFANEINKLDDKCHNKIQDLVLYNRNQNILYHREFSEKLDDVCDEYFQSLYRIILKYNMTFPNNNLNFESAFIDRVKSFKVYRNENFDLVYNEFKRLEKQINL